MTDYTKIRFRYPGDTPDEVEVESMWAIRRADGYELDNIPFYVCGVALGDIVEAKQDDDGLLWFQRVENPSGHSTIRILMTRTENVEGVRAYLRTMGCCSELSDVPVLFAVDVPPEVNYDILKAYLEAQKAKGVFEYEEGCLGFLPTVIEGGWYAVPLGTGGYAVGVVARKGRRGTLFGYFFGPLRERVPTLGDVQGLRPSSAALCAIFDDIGIQLGDWIPIGLSDMWNKEEWPLTELGRIEDEARDVASICSFFDVDISELPDERRYSVEEARGLPKSGKWGYEAVEKALTQKLAILN